MGKPFSVRSSFGTAGTVHFTALTAVQFSGGQISLTSCLPKLVPQLKHHLHPSLHVNAPERSGDGFQLEKALEMRFTLSNIKGLPAPPR